MSQEISNAQILAKPVKYAGFWERVVARALDLLLLGAASYTVHFAIDGFWLNLFNLVITNGYFCLFWTMRGATPGKMVLHQRIKPHEQGGTISVKAAIKRMVVEGATFGVAYLFIPFDSEHRGL